MRRVRRITLCDPADTLAVTTDHAAAEADLEEEAELPRRWSSCPDITLELSVATPSLKQTQGHRHKLRFSSGTQTEPTLNILPYETLFPFALPLQQGAAASKSLPPPQKLLDIYIDTAATTNYKDLNAQIQMLRSQVVTFQHLLPCCICVFSCYLKRGEEKLLEREIEDCWALPR